jgi:hypothetical protein
MKAKLFLLAGGCTLALAAPAAAAPGQCFAANGDPLGPVFDTEQPNTQFTTWVQARGGECRALRADEVTLYRGQPREYPMEFRRTDIRERPLEAVPGAPRSAPPSLAAPPSGTVTWDGDPTVARRLIVTHYQTSEPNLTIADTGRVVSLDQGGGAWRIYETTYADGSRRQVAVQMRPDRQYVLREAGDGGRWSETIELEE